MGGIWTVAKEVLVILVVPLLIWGVRLEVQSAVMEHQIRTLQEDTKKTDLISKAVQTQALQLARLEEKLDAAHKRLSEIVELIRN